MTPHLRDGALTWDDTPRLLLAGDYPYYRDDPALWAPKLRAMRMAGLEVVTFYVPWRHHELDAGRFAFDGPGNRDLIAFLAHVRQAGLCAVAKPGPFVHAELPLGGLPDRLSPTTDPRLQAASSAAGQPLLSQGMSLPSAHDPLFQRETAHWLEAVAAVLRPQVHPAGPLIGLQIGNEGHHGEMALSVSDVDYCPAALAAYRQWAGDGEGAATADPPQPGEHPVASSDATARYVRWGAWLSADLSTGMARLAQWLNLDVPILINAPAPASLESPSLDAWLARGATLDRGPVAYGYINWTENLAQDDAALMAYVLAARRGRGPNLEENWSLDWVNPQVKAACIPIYATLLGLACGASGMTVYTACATGSWGEHLSISRDFLAQSTGDATQLDSPYGAVAPIGLDGGPGPGFGALSALTAFLDAVGPLLIHARPEPGPVFWVQPEHSAVSAWNPSGHPGLPPTASSTLVPFLRHCLGHSIPFHVVDRLQNRNGPDLVPGTLLVTTSTRAMSRTTQYLLAAKVRAGVQLLLVGAAPEVDEHDDACGILAEALHGRDCTVPADQLKQELSRRLNHLARRHAGTLELRLSGPQENVFVFLFNRTARTRPVVTSVAGQELRTVLGPYGCAVVHLVGSRIRSCYVKGLNEQILVGTPVNITYGTDQVTTEHPCDLTLIRDDQGERRITTTEPTQVST